VREDSGGLFPPLRFPAELPAASTREFVVSGSAIVLRIAPLGNDVTVLLEPEQGRIDRSVKNDQLALADLFDAAGDPVSMKRPHRLKSP
jgi:hypothetical protein